MTTQPETRFVWSGDAGIAYQVAGDGPSDLVYVAGYVSNLDYQWRLPLYARFLQRLASFSRLIMIDRRGWGCSERFTPGQVPTLEDDVDDILAVMEATAASGSTIYLGSQEGCNVGMMAVAAHPDRFGGLILYGPSPSWTAIDGETISLDPSIGNWSYPCQSHYWIRRNRVTWAPLWSRAQIEAARVKDRAAKEAEFPGGGERETAEGGKDLSLRGLGSWLRSRLSRWFTRRKRA